MMMSGFVERVINSPQTRRRSAKQVGLQTSSERRKERVAVRWKTFADDSACDHETPHPYSVVVVGYGPSRFNAVLACIKYTYRTVSHALTYTYTTLPAKCNNGTTHLQQIRYDTQIRKEIITN